MPERDTERRQFSNPEDPNERGSQRFWKRFLGLSLVIATGTAGSLIGVSMGLALPIGRSEHIFLIGMGGILGWFAGEMISQKLGLTL